MSRKGIITVLTFIAAIVIFIGSVNTCISYGAETGVYTATVRPSYTNPSTGAVADSGGSEQTEMGQGMVEGATAGQGLIEVDSNGQMWGTIRLTLMDAMSNVRFQVDGSSVSSTITQNRGSVQDFRIPLNSENSIVKCSGFVDPMDRDVVYFITFSGLTPGSGDFVAMTDSSESEEVEKTDSEEEQEVKDEKPEKKSLGDLKSDAIKKIGNMKNLTEDQKKDFVAKITKAKSADELDQILKNAESMKEDKKEGLSTTTKGIAAAAVVIVIGVIVYILKNRKAQ